jgi:uncharacterized protein with PIN domain
MQARFGNGGVRALDALLRRAQIEIAPLDAEQAAIARDGFRRFGKGRHPAGLNLLCLCAGQARGRTVAVRRRRLRPDRSRVRVAVLSPARRSPNCPR